MMVKPVKAISMRVGESGSKCLAFNAQLSVCRPY